MDEKKDVKETLNSNKKKRKKLARKYLLPFFIGVLVIVIVASAVFTVFTTIRDKMIELATNIKTAVTSFWKWFTDDYWIKLDKKIDVTVINEDTRTRRN